MTDNEAPDLWAWMTESDDGWTQIGLIVPDLGGREVTLTFRKREVAERFEDLARAHGAGLSQRVELRRYHHAETIREPM